MIFLIKELKLNCAREVKDKNYQLYKDQNLSTADNRNYDFLSNSYN